MPIDRLALVMPNSGAGGANDPDSKHQQPAPAPAPAGPVGSFDDLFTANFERWMSVSVGTDAPYINAPPGPPTVRPVGKYDDIYTSDVFSEVRTTLLPLCSQEARLRLLPDADGEQKLQTVLAKQAEWSARGSFANFLRVALGTTTDKVPNVSNEIDT